MDNDSREDPRRGEREMRGDVIVDKNRRVYLFQIDSRAYIEGEPQSWERGEVRTWYTDDRSIDIVRTSAEDRVTFGKQKETRRRVRG